MISITKANNQWPLSKQIGLTITLSIIFCLIFFAHTPMTTYLFQYGIFSIFSISIVLKAIGGSKLFNYPFSSKPINFLKIAACLSFFFVMLICGTPLSFWYALHSKHILLIAATAITAGFSEEALFRGLLFSIFLKILQRRHSQTMFTYATVFSSLLFGFYHFVNFTGNNFLPVVAQVSYAFSFGLFFCFTRIAFNTLVIPIALHIYLDFQVTTLNAVSTSINWLTGSLTFLLIIISTIMYLLVVDKHLKSAYVSVSRDL
ncbi:CPBP family intramembrane glutamic endopeptidase [Lentilactobacillus farraginis]|uniref:Predicted metal-dependent membrane protease n=1 Tax=Lentilactobacillus farraginis DSM 18382 = JCM 14108 TaxID=1423743 RepID=X0PAP4_9LACO|nr:CPBP family intramembrane glutamic endopeptidase [Lentilactobacillus farraginis]KRM12180.1 hypothetical protein FD41_GL000535 [Lentilactobacillus farraginis DSM 18382 = JCM 14108]GAF36528.1 predicted metal-dependent membrane protease [Lentilactobacillus farraginis DSM 18382 = JCM 14108]